MRLALPAQLTLIWIALGTAGSSAAGPFDDLLRRVPGQANAVLVLDVQAAHKSPLGTRENWAEKHRHSFLGGLTGASPGVKRMVVGAQINAATLQKAWEVAVVELEWAMSQAELVKAVAGSADSMAGREVVLAPSNAYYVRLEPRVIGVMRPADRQATSRWVRGMQASGSLGLSPYLAEAAAKRPETAQAVMAVDLESVLDPEGVRQRLRKNGRLAGTGLDVEGLTRLLTGLRGVTLTLHIRDAITGELRVDFADPADWLAPVAKPLVLDALAGMGAAVEDLDAWQARVEGRSVVLRGPLTERGARQILSPLLRPTAVNVLETEPPNSLSAGPAAASQRYFLAVNTLLNDLKQQKVKTYQQLTYWYVQFAEKIDALPMVNVDEDLLKYGAAVSTTLRGLANLASNAHTLRKAALANSGEVLVEVPNAYYYYGYGPGWGYAYSFPAVVVVNNYALTNNFIAQTAATETALRNQTWKNIDAATSDVRRKMVAKYQVEFPTAATPK